MLNVKHSKLFKTVGGVEWPIDDLVNFVVAVKGWSKFGESRSIRLDSGTFGEKGEL
jgi:hypothetical protein